MLSALLPLFRNDQPEGSVFEDTFPKKEPVTFPQISVAMTREKIIKPLIEMNLLEPCPLLRRMFTLRIATRGLDWEPSSLILNLNSTILI